MSGIQRIIACPKITSINIAERLFCPPGVLSMMNLVMIKCCGQTPGGRNILYWFAEKGTLTTRGPFRQLRAELFYA